MTSALGFVSAGCLLTGVGLAGHWSTRRRDSLGRPRPFPVWSVTLLAVVALAAAIPGAQRRVQEHRLSRVASQLVGHSVSVHCQSTAGAIVDMGSELGYVPYDADGAPLPRTTIKRDPCKALRHYVAGGRRSPSYDEVVAVHVLTHEAMHMRGATDEAVAECEAVQRDAVTARLLGATPEQARALAVQYWRTVYPRMDEGYVSRDCAPGAPWDERLDTAPWQP